MPWMPAPRASASRSKTAGANWCRVIDDGWGIPADQLPLAFSEHATSKIRCDDDLFQITTLGFRGEALASIGAVAQARLLSRVAGSEAHEIVNQGGQIGAVRAASGNVGTTLEVRNFFFNTPARRKFLKGTSTELGHISEMMLRLALPYPQVAFTLVHGPKTLLDLPAQSIAERLLAAWPAEFHPHRLDIDAADADLHLGGIIGTPELARPTGKYQYIFLNGRFIRDRFIQHATREAYRGLIEPGRYPAAVLLLRLPPAGRGRQRSSHQNRSAIQRQRTHSRPGPLGPAGKAEQQRTHAQCDGA